MSPFGHDLDDELKGCTLHLVGSLCGIFGVALALGGVRGIFVFSRPVTDLLPGLLLLMGAVVVFKLSADSYLSREREEERFRQRFAFYRAGDPRLGDAGPRRPGSGASSRYVPDCLRTLGLARGCTEVEVRRAFRRRARHLHPDVGGDAEEFMRLEAAYRKALRLVRRQPVRRSAR